MSFLETVEKARAFLERNGRVSLSALRLEFGLDEPQIEALVEELVEIQQVAIRDGKALAWAGPATRSESAEMSETTEPARDPRDYTPKHLVEKILQSKSALEGERKQVTVLFADAKGSTQLAEAAGPEPWHQILDGYLRILAAGVGRRQESALLPVPRPRSRGGNAGVPGALSLPRKDGLVSPDAGATPRSVGDLRGGRGARPAAEDRGRADSARQVALP